MDNNESIDNLNGLNEITSIEGFLRIKGNGKLENLMGLDALNSVGGYLSVYSNNSLTSLNGAESLSIIEGGLDIEENFSLKHLTGLDNLSTVGSWVVIVSNTSLKSLHGLESLTSMGSGLEIRMNDSLTNITGVENIDYTGMSQLVIMDNPLLSECEVKSVCNYLTLTNNSNDYIQSNTDGCNSKVEIVKKCEPNAVNYGKDQKEFGFYPNPAHNNLTIKTEYSYENINITIYDQFGIVVLPRTEISDNINISMLGKGFYIVELTFNGANIRKKLIIK